MSRLRDGLTGLAEVPPLPIPFSVVDRFCLTRPAEPLPSHSSSCSALFHICRVGVVGLFYIGFVVLIVDAAGFYRDEKWCVGCCRDAGCGGFSSSWD